MPPAPSGALCADELCERQRAAHGQLARRHAQHAGNKAAAGVERGRGVLPALEQGERLQRERGERGEARPPVGGSCSGAVFILSAPVRALYLQYYFKNECNV